MFVSKNVLKGYFCMCLSLPLNNCTPIKPLKTMCCLWFGLFFPQFCNYTYDNAVMGEMGLDDNRCAVFDFLEMFIVEVKNVF